jgi:radical SAM superfamily enzyme YgiQ (UPF0313 family)
MNKILLINPPFSRKEEYKFWISSVGTKANPPLGLAYIAAMCLKKGYEVEIIDALAEDLTPAELKQRIIKINPGIVGVTATTPMINNAFEVLKLVKESSGLTLTVLGGPHITAEPFFTMNECKELDIGVLGEGEDTFAELIKTYLTSNRSLGEIKGIIYRKDGQIITNPPRISIKNLDDIPFPAYHLLPMRLYSPSPFNYRRQPAVPIICSRGCPFQCIFCTKGLFGNSVRRLSPRKVYEQVKYLVDNYKIREVHFYDDTFILDEGWVKEVCSYLEKLNILWWCNGRVDIMTKEILSSLKKAGCYRIYYGVESGNEKSLKVLKKVTSIKKIKNAFKITQETNIETGAFMMLGIPGENREDMQRSIDFVKEIKADHAVFSVLTPYPGTEIYKDHKKYGIMTKTSWKDFIMISNDPIFVSYSTTKAELNRYLTLAYKSIVFSPRFIKNKIKDMFYSPWKIFFYTKGLVSTVKGIFSDFIQRNTGES